MATLTATIYGYSDGIEAEQSVEIQYTGSGFRRFTVDYLKVVTQLEIEPGDLYADLANAIEKHEQADDVRIDCEIELPELVRA